MYYFTYYVYDFGIMQLFSYLVRCRECLLQLETQDVDEEGPSHSFRRRQLVMMNVMTLGGGSQGEPGGREWIS